MSDCHRARVVNLMFLTFIFFRTSRWTHASAYILSYAYMAGIRIMQQLAKLSAEHRTGELLYGPDLSDPIQRLRCTCYQEFQSYSTFTPGPRDIRGLLSYGHSPLHLGRRSSCTRLDILRCIPKACTVWTK